MSLQSRSAGIPRRAGDRKPTRSGSPKPFSRHVQFCFRETFSRRGRAKDGKSRCGITCEYGAAKMLQVEISSQGNGGCASPILALPLRHRPQGLQPRREQLRRSRGTLAPPLKVVERWSEVLAVREAPERPGRAQREGEPAAPHVSPPPDVALAGVGSTRATCGNATLSDLMDSARRSAPTHASSMERATIATVPPKSPSSSR